jgi:uncharacterized membrane protein
MDYLVVKWLHVLSSTILFGAGVGSAFHLFASSLRGAHGRRGRLGAQRGRGRLAAHHAQRDCAAGHGLWLIHLMRSRCPPPGWPGRWRCTRWRSPAGCRWCAIQIRMRGMAVEAEHGCEPCRTPTAACSTGGRARLRRLLPFLLIFWLMVAKRLPWAA